jgi:hypothetical protein
MGSQRGAIYEEWQVREIQKILNIECPILNVGVKYKVLSKQ